MLKKPISYFIIFSVIHSSLAQVAYGMFPEQEYKHVPFVQPKAQREQKQENPNEEIPVSASKLISSSQNLVRESSIYTPSPSLTDLGFVKDTAQPELPTSQPQAIVKQSNTVPANDPNSLELQSHSGSPTHIPGDSTLEKSGSSSTTSSPEKSPREEKDTVKGGCNTSHENRSNVTTVVSSDLNVPVQQQLIQVQVQEESIMNQNLGTNTKQDEEGDVFHDALDHDDSVTIDIEGKGVAQTSKIVHPPSSQPKPSEKTPLISKKKDQDDQTESLLVPSKDIPPSPAKKSFISQAWDIATGFFKRKEPGKEPPSSSVTDSSSPLLMANDDRGDSDSSEGADESVEDHKNISSGEEEKTLEQKSPSINQQPVNHGSGKELDLYNSDEKSWVIVDLKKTLEANKKGILGRVSLKGNKNNDDAPDNEKDLTLIPIDNPELPPAVRAFLLHVKDRVIDGKLNGKQIAGIVGGVALGATVAMPLIAIFNDGVFELNDRLNGQLHGETPLTKSITGIMGPTLGLDAASRTATILVHYGESDTSSFSIKKNKTHRCTLILAKSGIYTGALIAGSLPLFYLYSYSYLCDGKECTEVETSPQPPWVEGFFAGFGPILVLDTTLQYGYQLSQQAERTINKRFSRLRNLFSPTEQKRQAYLDYLKNLKKIVYFSDANTLYNLYEDIFEKKNETISTDKKTDSKDLKTDETLRVLRSFHTFYQQLTKPGESKKKETVRTKKDESEEEEALKQANSSKWGWVMATAATVGRTVVFSHIVETMLHAVGVHGPWNQGLTVIFGGLIGNLIQGKIEKDAAKQVAYDIGRGKKIPTNGSSHRPLRIGIKGWDYLYGACNTLPYVLVGINATHTWNVGWRVVTLVPFGLADTFNNATAFHDSNLAVVDAFDSTISYCYPFEGYKRDRLVRKTRQLYRLFKNLEPQVLEIVDQKLKMHYN